MAHKFLLACSHIMYGGYPTLRLYYTSKTRTSGSFVDDEGNPLDLLYFQINTIQIAWDELCWLSQDNLSLTKIETNAPQFE
jgi:hypothetical protein